ncbi:MAG: hypothetical protein KC592_11105 [Nitrospira sp.]|nr:hypothetical protein [Nitrospira sp.]MCW5784613.1 hypothetical protein [Nitrospirales bacterium]
MSLFRRLPSCMAMVFVGSIGVLSFVGSAQASDAKGRTVVVHINSFDADRTTNGLLFAKHTCQFLPDAAHSTVRVLFSNAGVFNALKDLNHPKNRVPTLESGDDDPKHAKSLVRKLLGHVTVNPPLLCNVEVVATGLGLKSYGKTADDLIDGVQVGGPMPSSPVQVPAYLTTPAEEGQPIVVIDW